MLRHRWARALDPHYGVQTCAAARDAWVEFKRKTPDLAIAAFNVPGLEFLQNIRTHTDVTPVIFTGAANDDDQVLGFQKGADDFLNPDISDGLLLERVNMIFRRGAYPNPGKHHFKSLTLDPKNQTASWKNMDLGVGFAQYRLLDYFVSTKGTILDAGKLSDFTGSDVSYVALASQIKRLRRKFKAVGADPIRTIYSGGFVFDENYARPVVLRPDRLREARAQKPQKQPVLAQ